MAGVKISELPALSTPALSAIFPVVQGGTTSKITLNQLSGFYLLKSGGTMTGPLILAGAPSLSLEAASKGYVDSQLTNYLPLSGGTLSGQVSQASAPLVDANLSNKKYVDDVAATKLSLTGGTLSGTLTLAGAPTNANDAATKAYADAQSANKLPLAGGTMTGPIVLAGNPVNSNDASNKNYVDQQVNTRLPLAGGTMTGNLTLVGSPSTNNMAANKLYVDSTAANYLPLSGGTMTGPIVLPGAPTTDLQSSTKKYVDDTVASNVAGKVNRSGDTMTGYLKLYADPFVAMDAATKQYVDNKTQYFNPPVYAAAVNNLANAQYSNGASGIGATLSSTVNGIFAIDGISIPDTARVLIKAEPNDAWNGIYVVADKGTVSSPWILSRALDFDQPSEISPGDRVLVLNGVVNGGTEWVQTATVNTIGTDPIIFEQFGSNQALLKANNLSDLTNTATARTNLGLGSIATYADTQVQTIKRTTVSNANYTAVGTDRYIAQVGTLSATRNWTLPYANTVPAGTTITIADESGSAKPSTPVTIQARLGDILNGSGSYFVPLNYPYATASFITNGSNAWTYIAIPNYYYFRANLTLSGAYTSTMNNVYFQRVGNECWCQLYDNYATATSTTTLNVNGIPSGYRPNGNVNIVPQVRFDTNYRAATGYVNSSGQIILNADMYSAVFSATKDAGVPRQIIRWYID